MLSGIQQLSDFVARGALKRRGTDEIWAIVIAVIIAERITGKSSLFAAAATNQFPHGTWIVVKRFRQFRRLGTKTMQATWCRGSQQFNQAFLVHRVAPWCGEDDTCPPVRMEVRPTRNSYDVWRKKINIRHNLVARLFQADPTAELVFSPLA